MHVDDAADAAVFLLRHWSADEPINIGTGEDVSIAELARAIAGVVGFTGHFAFDQSKPDGAPRKALDASKLLAMGWRAQVRLDQGLRETYEWFCKKIGTGAA
jgi:GDP-L-fucose synthase